MYKHLTDIGFLYGGITQAQFVAEALEQAATRVLTGQPEEAEAEAPTPALVKRMEETDAKLEALAAQESD